MTNQDRYIAKVEARGDAFNDAASYVPASTEQHGVNVRDQLRRIASACYSAAEDARCMSASEFNRSGIS